MIPGLYGYAANAGSQAVGTTRGVPTLEQVQWRALTWQSDLQAEP